MRRAATAIAPHLSLPVPLVYSPSLSERLDAHVSLKLEFANPVGVFKLRGGIFLAGELSDEHRRAGVVSASTGNHAQSIAYGARLFDVPAVLFVPEDANPDKLASIERLGSKVRKHGERFDDARVAAEQYAAEFRMRYVHSANEPALIAGVGTAALEVLEVQQPETDVVIVPIGGGSGAAGWLTVRDGLGHDAEIWGVQSAQAPAVHDSWRAREVLERPNTTTAEGLATAVAYGLTLDILSASLDDFVLVDDSRIEAAVVELLRTQHLLVEPAGASPLAAAISRADRVRGKRLVLVLSGANITLDQLNAILGRAAGQ
ncbi:MAG: threonine/serine dehydratase [Dehalococcoidia bacterium]